ncbi:MAG TPA: MBL fold metallo-hydrolase, partial [Stellaceae bacterium]|nr:MBL fold metallo-hydrolase [Stellaceae bacterium]
APLFPIPIEVFGAKLEFHDFNAGETLDPQPGIRLVTAPLNHPDGATGYRVEFAGKAVAYITDTEHREGQSDDAVLKLMQGADVAIYDSMYTDAEYAKHRGWGHSTWQEGVRLATEAGTKQLVIFHHEPSHTDATMDRIAEEAAKLKPGTIVAREGLVLAV